MSSNRRTFSIRTLLFFAAVCAAGMAYWRMTQPIPLSIHTRLGFNRAMPMAPSAPMVYRNPLLARKINAEYKKRVTDTLALDPKSVSYWQVSPSARRFAKENPKHLAEKFNAWFSPNASDELLLNACHTVQQLDHKSGLEQATQELIRRFQSSEDPKAIAKLISMAGLDPEALLPQLEGLMQRFPTDRDVVYRAVMQLDENGAKQDWGLPQPTIDLLTTWLESDDENDQYVALQGLAHTSFRESTRFGEQIRARIAKNRAHQFLNHALNENSGPWVADALAEIHDKIAEDTRYAEPLCKHGDDRFIDYYKSQLEGQHSQLAFQALVRTTGDDDATGTLKQAIEKRRSIALMKVLLDHAGEKETPYCLNLIDPSDADKLLMLSQTLIENKTGQGNKPLLMMLEAHYLEQCELPSFLAANRLLNALKALAHPEIELLAERLPAPDQNSAPAGGAPTGRGAIEDFVAFLNQSKHGVPVEMLAVESLNEDIEDGWFLHNCMLHDALQSTQRAMEFDAASWRDLPELVAKLADMSDGVFAPDGIRVGDDDKVEISWRRAVFADDAMAYEDDPGGVIDLANAILDYFKISEGRFVAYPNERGNEYPTIAFLTNDETELLDTRFGLKALIAE